MLINMSSLTDIEGVVRSLSLEELQQLERVVQAARRARESGPQRSVLDLPPLGIGRLVGPLALDDLFGEMLDDVRH